VRPPENGGLVSAGRQPLPLQLTILSE